MTVQAITPNETHAPAAAEPPATRPSRAASSFLRSLRLVPAAAGSMVLLLAGLACLDRAEWIAPALDYAAGAGHGLPIAYGLAVCWLAAAQVVFLCFVADAVCGCTQAPLALAVKTVLSMVMVAAMVWTLYWCWPMIRLALQAAAP